MKPKFSVAMCVYGGDNAAWVDEALESVYHQTTPPNEVVMVVDGPVPSEIERVIKKYEAAHGLTVKRLPRNAGHGNARREALALCQYDYVAIADADDINVPTRFEKQLACFEEDPGLGAVSSACIHFEGSVEHILNEEKLPVSDDGIKEYMKSRCPLCQASTILNKAEVERAGGYQDWYGAEDYYLWIRMCQAGARFHNVEESLLYVRTSKEQIGRRGGWRYYRSIRGLFRFMREKGMIGWVDYWYATAPRFVLQVLMPSRLRAFVRKKAM